MHDDAYPFTVP